MWSGSPPPNLHHLLSNINTVLFVAHLKVTSLLLSAKTNCVDTTITNLLESKDETPIEATGTLTFGPLNSSYSSGSAPTMKVSLFYSAGCWAWAIWLWNASFAVHYNNCEHMACLFLIWFTGHLWVIWKHLNWIWDFIVAAICCHTLTYSTCVQIYSLLYFIMPFFFLSQPAAKSFGKSPADRHLSLQERKEMLYNFARRCDFIAILCLWDT